MRLDALSETWRDVWNTAEASGRREVRTLTGALPDRLALTTR